MYTNIYNKLNTTNITICLLLFNVIFLLYLFYLTKNNFFKIIINICYIFNFIIILSYLKIDFFSALLISAELPIIIVLAIFYFHKNSLQVDALYVYKKNKLILAVFFLFGFVLVLYMLNTKSNINFTIYNFLINDSLFIYNKNDFLIFFYLLYKINPMYVILFAFFIFFVSLVVIFVFQNNKLYLVNNKLVQKNITILRNQNMLKQSLYKTKIKFFNKKL